jgi:hypothetical protein
MSATSWRMGSSSLMKTTRAPTRPRTPVWSRIFEGSANGKTQGVEVEWLLD